MLKSLSVWGLNVVKGRSSGSNRIATHRLWLTIMGILSVTLIVSVSSAQQTTRWNNPGGGYWDVAANWDNGVPDSTKIAVIDLPGTYTVTIRSNAVAAGLILGNDDPSDTGTKVLQVGASFTLNGDGLAKSRTIVALFDWGRLTGSGTLRVEGELRLRHGSIQEGSGVTLIAPSGKVTTDLGGGSTTLRRRLVNEGSVEIGLSGTYSGGVLRIGQGGVLENKGILRLKTHYYDARISSDSGRLVNENGGVIESVQDSSRDTYITARLENRGTVRSRSHSLYLSDVVLLDGSKIGAGEGTVRLAEGGRMEVAEGATALVESGAVFAFASTLTGSSRLTGSGTLRVEGELRLRHGSIQEGSGVTLIAPSGKVTTDLGGGSTTLRRRLVNEGSVEIGLLSGTRSGGVLLLGQGGVLENKGMLRLRSYDPDTATIAPTDAPNAGKVVNEGIIESTQDSSRDTYITARLENRGTVRSRSHNLYLGDVVLLDGGRIGAGEGIVRVDPGGQVEVAEGATALVESGAVFAFASTLTGSSRLTGSGTLRVEGELRLGHGSIQEGSGVTLIAPNGKLTTDLGGGSTTLRRRLVNEGSVEIGLSGTYSGGVLRIGQGGVLENKGILRLKTHYYDARISSSDSGRLVNENGGVIESVQDSSRDTYITARLENRGTVRSRSHTLYLSDVLLLDGGRISAGEGTVQIADGSRVEVAEGATALVESGAVFIVGYSGSATSTSTLTGSGTLRVEGELRLEHGSIQEGSGVTWIAPSGKVTTKLHGGTTTLRRRLVNEGSVEIGLLSGTRSGGVLRLGQGGVLENKGILKLRSYGPDTATIAPTDAPNAGKVVNEGIVESTQDSSRDTYITARLENRGTVRSRSHSLYLSDVVLLDGSKIGAGEGTVRLAEGGRMEVAEGATALVESGVSFVLANLSGSNVLTGSGTLRVEGELRLGHGSIQEGSGVTWIAPSGKVTTELGGGTTTLRRRLVNEGSVEIGLSGTYSGGVMRIGQGGVLENKGTLKLKSAYYAATIAPVSPSDSGKLVNKGTIMKQEGDNIVYINLELRNEGKVQVSAGTLQLSTYYQIQTGSLEIGIGGMQASEYGRINVTGSAWINGSLIVSLLNDFAPPVGTSFQVLTVNQRVGDFRSTDIPGDMVSEWSDRSLKLTVMGGFFVSSAQPMEIPNAGTVQMTIKGSGFQQGIIAILRKGNTIVEAETIVVESVRLIRANFILSDIPAGDYELIVRSVDNQEAKLTKLLKVYDERVLSILAVDPDEIIQRPTLGTVTFHVRGTQFSSDAQVYLQRLDKDDTRISPIGTPQWLSPTELEVTFNLSPSQTKIGMYELVIQRGTNQARYPVFLFPYMAIMSDDYTKSNVLVIGRITRHTVTLNNWGNAVGVGVYALALPSGFEMVNVYPGPGGEWGVAPDGTIVIAQPVQPGESVSVGIDVRLNWDNVIPPNQQPEPGKYRLGDMVLFKGTLVASPVLELWSMVKSRGGNNWEDITAEAMVAHGAITGVYMDEFMELKVRGGHEFILRLGERFPALANAMEMNLQLEMYTYAAAALGFDVFGGQLRKAQRSRNNSKPFIWQLCDELWLTGLYTYEDFISGKMGAITVAQWEGIVEGLTFGTVQVNLTEKYARLLGYNSLHEMQQELGIQSWQISAMKMVGGAIGPSPLQKIPIGGIVANRLTSLSKGLFEKLDGKKINISSWIFSFGKGVGPEPVRFGIDKLVTIHRPLAGWQGFLVSPGRANVFHIGYMKPNPEKGIAGGWHIGIGSVPKVVFKENGIEYLAAGPHFYLNRFYHPDIGEVYYDWLIRSFLVARGDLADQVSRLDKEFLQYYLESERLKRDLLDNFRATLVAAWDPNSIEVMPLSQYINPQQRLSFIIHFENLPEANFPAEDVTIKLILDDDLDIDSLTFDGSSNPNVLITAIDKETRTVIWRFVGINLPPNQNPPEGEGWVQFSVNLKQGVSSGTEVVAKAEIRFDENPPIETNEVKVTVDAQPPTSQVAELPAEQTRGTFEVSWHAQDDLSGVSQSEIWVNEESADGRHRQRKNNDGRMVNIEEKIYIPLAVRSSSQEFKAQIRAKFGYVYRFFAISKDAVDNLEGFPTQPQATTQVGRAPQIPQGLRIVSVPVQSEDDDPKVVFNFPENKWAIWDPTANNGQGGYVIYPNNATKFGEPEKIPGRAYWVRLNEATVPKVFGPLPDDNQPFVIQLKRGWNLIGNPWLVDLIWNLEAIQVQVGSETKPLKNAQGIVEPYAWRWDGNNYQLVFDQNLLPNVDNNKIPAWEGAWVFAWQDCNLIIPPPEANKGRRTRLAGNKIEGWFARLIAQVGEQEGKGFFGIAPNTRLQITQPPSPPEGQSEETVQVLFLDKNGNSTIADIRAEMEQRQEWDVVVKWDMGQGTRGMEQRKEVNLTFDGIGYAPKDVSLWLVDKVTGKRLYMRTQSAYRFVPNEGETSRQFKVIAELSNTRPLQVVGLKATPMRGRNLAIQFSLTKPAQTQVEILTLTGRKVVLVEVGRNRLAGQHQVIWQGHSNNGEFLPAGAYLIRVIAQDEEGRQVQATTVARLK